MHDNYSHIEDGIAYIDENIPGSEEQSNEYTSLMEMYNSQLVHSCSCSEKCNESNCDCLKISGGANYTSELGSHILKLYKIKNENVDFTYPVIECSEYCKCFENCGNRLVQNGPIETLYVTTCKQKSIGLGLFTSQFIGKGTFICEYAGEVITKSEAVRRHQYNEKNCNMNYIFCLNEHVNNTTIQTFIDPRMFGNIGRYINHSCEPKSVIIPVRVNSPIPKLAVFSCVDIFPNEEITCDYGADNLISSISQDLNKVKMCLCGSKMCRGYMPYNVY
ncbi:histone-lysine N-methyltransferase SETMAR [Melitaea cinxia]|uniref:histone-lysine N-methyltransferase SETMAR n=1 Tax=Melitaea cinxia TaxID=113334 RepID=UPI001E26F661|nr:histone-lysine N-methyltransferase SETMAR [Melitaea cinxia]